MNPARTKRGSPCLLRGLRVIIPEEVAALSRAVTSEPITRSSASVDGNLLVLMSLPMLRRTKDSSKVSSIREKKQLQSKATDMSLRTCSLPAKSTCAQTLSVGTLRSTTSMWITAGDHLSHCFLYEHFPPFYLHDALCACVCVVSMACTHTRWLTHYNDIHIIARQPRLNAK